MASQDERFVAVALANAGDPDVKELCFSKPEINEAQAVNVSQEAIILKPDDYLLLEEIKKKGRINKARYGFRGPLIKEMNNIPMMSVKKLQFQLQSLREQVLNLVWLEPLDSPEVLQREKIDMPEFVMAELIQNKIHALENNNQDQQSFKGKTMLNICNELKKVPALRPLLRNFIKAQKQHLQQVDNKGLEGETFDASLEIYPDTPIIQDQRPSTSYDIEAADYISIAVEEGDTFDALLDKYPALNTKYIQHLKEHPIPELPSHAAVKRLDNIFMLGTAALGFTATHMQDLPSDRIKLSHYISVGASLLTVSACIAWNKAQNSNRGTTLCKAIEKVATAAIFTAMVFYASSLFKLTTGMDILAPALLSMAVSISIFYL